MSLTSYRAAPSRAIGFWRHRQRYEIEDFSRLGGDLLSHVLRRSTIGATALNGRVRDGIGCFARAMTTKPRKILDISMCPSDFCRGQAWLLLDQIKPIGQLVLVS